MRFNPEMIASLNASYHLDIFKKSLQSYEDGLTYSKCLSCGMIYCPIEWPDVILSSVYQETIDHEQSRKKTQTVEKKLTMVREWEIILRLMAIHGQKSISDLKLVDYGCGWGDFLETVKGPGVEAVGFETDRIKAGHAMEKGLTLLGSVEALKQRAPFDVFVMNAVIEHVQNVRALLNLAVEVLKPGGMLVVSTMDFRPRFIQANLQSIMNNRKPLSMYLNPVEHVNVYDYTSVMKTLQKHSLEVLATRSVMEYANMPIPFLRKNRTS